MLVQLNRVGDITRNRVGNTARNRVGDTARNGIGDTARPEINFRANSLSPLKWTEILIKKISRF